MALAVETASSFVNASPEDLRCSICPSQPKFTNASHLLTHLSSKLHLKHCFELELQAKIDFLAAQKLLDYQEWFHACGLELALAQRQKIKELRNRDREIEREEIQSLPPQIFVKKERTDDDFSFPEEKIPRSTRQSLRLQAPLYDDEAGEDTEQSQLDNGFPFGSDDLDYQTAIHEEHPEIYEEMKSICLSAAESKAGIYTTFKARPVRTAPLNQYWNFPEDALAVSATKIIEDDEIVDPKEVKLKGKVWPGMRVFDWATPELKAKRLANGGVKKPTQARPPRAIRKSTKSATVDVPPPPSPDVLSQSPTTTISTGVSTSPKTPPAGAGVHIYEEAVSTPSRYPSEQLPHMYYDGETASMPKPEKHAKPDILLSNAPSYSDGGNYSYNQYHAPIHSASTGMDFFGYGGHANYYPTYGQPVYGTNNHDSLRHFANAATSVMGAYDYNNINHSNHTIVPFTNGYYHNGNSYDMYGGARAFSGLQSRPNNLTNGGGWSRRTFSNVSFESDISTCSTLTERSLTDLSTCPSQCGEAHQGCEEGSEYGEDSQDGEELYDERAHKRAKHYEDDDSDLTELDEASDDETPI